MKGHWTLIHLNRQNPDLAEIFSYPHAFGIKRNQCPSTPIFASL
jgi:hypothetical protein